MTFPQEFIDTIDLIDKEELLFALNTAAPISIRINSHKINASLFDKLEGIPYNENAFYLDTKPSFTLDPLFHAGAYYVQEASSMLITQAIKRYYPKSDSNVFLDLCAAPGGKSTLISSLLHENDILVANEVIRTRAGILKENISKWGLGNTIVTNNDPKDYANHKHAFDLILVDAPCSGEGMFRKDTDARNEWSPDNVALCSERQQRILSDIWDCLKPNGILLYSTCTFNKKENEDVADWLCNEYNAECLSLDIDNGITECRGNYSIIYKCFPHKVKGEGFSLGIFRKADGDSIREKRNKKKHATSDKVDSKQISDWTTLDNIIYKNIGDEIWGYNEFADLFIKKSQHINIIAAGIPIALPKGTKMIPHPALAFSIFLGKKKFPMHSIDKKTALQYFKKEALKLNTDKRGWIILLYKDTPIGFVNNLGNRANNPYPGGWRIRMEIPEELPLTVDDLISQ